MKRLTPYIFVSAAKAIRFKCLLVRGDGIMGYIHQDVRKLKIAMDEAFTGLKKYLCPMSLKTEG